MGKGNYNEIGAILAAMEKQFKIISLKYATFAKYCFDSDGGEKARENKHLA